MAKGSLEGQLHFERKNQNLVKVPKCYARIQKRPIPHAPVASPYAGANVPKIVYVSSNSPFMSVVKRVQKLLRQAEKRATSSIGLTDSKVSEKEKLARLARGQEQLAREEIFVKATGRAVEKALGVGKWFEEKTAEYTVRYETGSVLVVDDIVEDEQAKQKLIDKEMLQTKSETAEPQTETSGGAKEEEEEEEEEESNAQGSRKKKKRKHAAFDLNADLPETRTRWVKMVQVAVTLR
ncbi:hypothetical protein ASPZODRAFT_138471 [Penicilliopsis zonata CBS 506.65]|uniref:Uncharacterized protein n=1 Tax=Penicilliopsis zonata CBS 506.65 TaxID=1073090 RepID=A0A1L9SVZ3_9EURO|nr:hypothetical protein ASPZODRAFT_138471 [Penicilliopsis zonata CBS 506.65]OJJ51370.1 hypothetical protein ASPZODRAFT_138471 [Penicilliopsis zonata CBS 506.65]